MYSNEHDTPCNTSTSQRKASKELLRANLLNITKCSSKHNICTESINFKILLNITIIYVYIFVVISLNYVFSSPKVLFYFDLIEKCPRGSSVEETTNYIKHLQDKQLESLQIFIIYLSIYFQISYIGTDIFYKTKR